MKIEFKNYELFDIFLVSVSFEINSFFQRFMLGIEEKFNISTDTLKDEILNTFKDTLRKFHLRARTIYLKHRRILDRIKKTENKWLEKIGLSGEINENPISNINKPLAPLKKTGIYCINIF